METADWSAFRLDNKALNSFGRLKVSNATHLYWEQVSVKGGEVLDSIWITQKTHGPFHQAQLETEKASKIEEKKKEELVIITGSQTKHGSTSPMGDPNMVSGNADSPDVSISGRARSMLESTNVRIALGVGGGVLVLVVIITVVILQKQKRKARKYRRWDETVDYGRKFYSSGYGHVQGGEKDMDEDVEISDPNNLQTTKLLTE